MGACVALQREAAGVMRLQDGKQLQSQERRREDAVSQSATQA